MPKGLSLSLKSRSGKVKALTLVLVFLVVFTLAFYIGQSPDSMVEAGGLSAINYSPGMIPGDTKGMNPGVIGNLPVVTLAMPDSDEATLAKARRVWIGKSYVAGADGNPILLVNSRKSKNPSWSQLLEFLQQDKTDRQRYESGRFVCADYAEMLHNNAERAGWRCAYVCISLNDNADSTGKSPHKGHALNAFETTDCGLVYIDCMNASAAKVICADKIVNVTVGKQYLPHSIFPENGRHLDWESMGVVTAIATIKW